MRNYLVPVDHFVIGLKLRAPEVEWPAQVSKLEKFSYSPDTTGLEMF